MSPEKEIEKIIKASDLKGAIVVAAVIGALLVAIATMAYATSFLKTLIISQL